MTRWTKPEDYTPQPHIRGHEITFRSEDDESVAIASRMPLSGVPWGCIMGGPKWINGRLWILD